MRLMTSVLRSFSSKFVVVYFDDILVYCLEDTSHIGHLCQVFEVLRTNQLYINKKKCSYLQNSLVFLGFVIEANDI